MATLNNNATTITAIYNNILAQKSATSGLNSLNNPSQTAIWNLWAYITAVCIWIQTQLWSTYQSQIETIISSAPVLTDSYVQQQVFKFQYSDTNPQVIQLDSNFNPSYPTVNPNLQIISQCSVNTLPNTTVSIKVATQTPPQALTSGQTLSLSGYLSQILPAGVQQSVISLPADQCYINGNVYYNGQYSSTIQNSVVQAINNFFINLPFDGVLRVSALEQAILSVTGVEDFEFINLAIRPNATPISAATYLVNNYTQNYTQYGTYSGYIISEQTVGYTLPNSINFLIQ